MLSANKEKIQSFLTGTSQYSIPFFQRSYVWKMDNWTELWENILEEIEAFKSHKQSEHFIGTIIIKQADSHNVGSLEYDLIDGQQRLTTICLFLKALHDHSEDQNLKNWIYNLLAFNDSYGNQRIRIVHSRVDKPHFEEIMHTTQSETWEELEALGEKDFLRKLSNIHKIKAAYFYFRRRISEHISIEDLRNCCTIILEKLPVIHMALSKEDDVQQIFDTINSLGVKLTTAELLKNYLFSFPKVTPYYESLWEQVFEPDEETIEFWNKERTAGRVRRTTVELFLYSFLVIKKEQTVRIEKLFKEFKAYLKDLNEDELLLFAQELKEYAEIYFTLPDGEELTEISYKEHEKRFFHIMREFEITTIFPIVLYLYKRVTVHDERIYLLRLLESYLSRRTICKLTTKNYNNLFLSILGELKSLDDIYYNLFQEKLMGYTENSNRFPDDDELKKGFHSSSLINKYSREVLFNLALKQQDEHFHDVKKLNVDSFSLEHIMPKKWKNEWGKAPQETGEEYRNFKLKTLGNLALINGRLNSSLRDAKWSKKRKALKKYSSLRMTTDYLEEEVWNEEVIKERAKDLYQIALSVWER